MPGEWLLKQVPVRPACPSPLLGMDFSLSLGGDPYSLWTPEPRNAFGWTMYYTRHGNPSQIIPPETERLLEPQVWNQGIPGMAKFVTPIKITLKETNYFLSRCRYSQNPEVQWFLQPPVSQFIKYGFLCQASLPVILQSYLSSNQVRNIEWYKIFES